MKLKNYMLKKYKFNSIEELNKINEYSIIKTNVVYDAMKLLLEHINKKSKILIINDYDADGISSLLIFYNFLKTIFPYSHIDYYTLNLNDNRKIDYKDEFKKYDLIITLDCGVNSIKFEAECIANKQDLIVIDHHIIETPVRSIKLHPETLSYTFNMSGSGLTIKFVEALANYLPLDKEKINEFIDYLYIFAGIGTITDLVGVLNENRKILLKGYTSSLKYETFLNKIFKTKTNAILYYSLYGSLLNSLFKMQSAVEYSINLMNLYNKNEDEIKKAINLYDKKKEIINEAYVNFKNNVVKESENYYIIKLNTKYKGIAGALLNRILHNTNKKYVIGITKLEDNNYKLSIRSKEKLILIFLIKNLFIDGGGHDYAYSGIISEENLKKFLNKIETMVVNLNIKTKEDIVDLDEIYDEEFKNDVIALIPYGIDFNLPNIKITKNISNYPDIIFSDINTSDYKDKIYKISLLKTLYRFNKVVVLEEVI